MTCNPRPAFGTVLTMLIAFLLGALVTPSPVPAAVDTPDLFRIGGIGGLLEAVAVADGTAYVGVGPTLTVLDVRDPAAPSAIAELHIGGAIRDLHLAGSRLYVANYFKGELQIVDVAYPFAPALLGSVTLPGNPTSVAVAGGYAYVAAFNGGLQVVDVRDPTSPQRVFESQWALGSTLDVEVADGLVYFTSFGRLVIADITTPDAPQLRAVYELIRGGTDVANGRGLFIAGDLAYLAVGANGLYLFDVSNPADPRRIGIVDTPGFALDLVVEDGRAYVAEREGGLTVVDVSNPAGAQVLANLDTDGSAGRVAFADGFVFLADGGGGLDSIDVRGASPIRVGGYGVGGNSNAVSVQGELAYVAGREGLHIIDVNQPARPRVLGSIDLGGRAAQIYVNGEIVYLTGSFLQNGRTISALWVVDAANPAAPALLTQFTVEDRAFGKMWKRDTILYVTENNRGLGLFDVGNPRAPAPLRTIQPGGMTYLSNIELSGERGYVRADANRLVILDLNALEGQAILSSTAFAGSTGQSGQIGAISVFGDTAFVSVSYQLQREPGSLEQNYVHDVYSVDVSDPTSPRTLGQYTFSDTTFLGDLLAISPNELLVATRNGVDLLDVGDPANPTLLTRLALDRSSTSLTAARGLIFATGYQAGLQVLSTAPRFLGAQGQIDGAGVVTSADNSMTLDFGEGALPGSATVVQLEQLTTRRPAPGGEVVRSLVIEARGSDGRPLDAPAMPYLLSVQTDAASSMLNRGVGGTQLAVTAWDGTGWSELPACEGCHTQPGQVIVWASSFTEFAVVRRAHSSTPSPTTTATASATPTETATPQPTSSPTPSPTRGPATQERFSLYLPALQR